MSDDPYQAHILLSAIERAGDAIEIADDQGRLLYVNAAFEAQTGYAREEILGLTPAQFMRSPREPASLFAEIWETITVGRAWHGEYTRRRKDGAIIPIEVSVSPVADADGKIIRFIIVSREISRRREEEARVARSLAEKETLLREIHHRVKNNLQIISSMLMLRSDTTASPDARAALEDSVHRLRSMALIHQQLYGMTSLARVDLGAYARALCESLRAALAPAAAVEVRADVVEVSIDLAVPLGLILNELVTNAFKYGARRDPDGGVGPTEVEVEVRAADGGLRVEVADHGPGLPPEVDGAARGSVGLQIVTVLCRQLRATLARGGPPGARFVLACPLAADGAPLPS